MLSDILSDEMAPIYIIRLWGHCQNRREWIFYGMPVQATKAICRYQGDAERFESALIECGFLSRDGDQITVVGWDEHNASLIANWKNGARGGRPKGSTKETRQKPMGKPKENPSDNPSRTDKIGCDKIDNTPLPPKGDVSEPDCKSIIELYNRCLPENPKATNITDNRIRAIGKLWGVEVKIPVGDDVKIMTTDSLDFWERYFRRASEQGHLIGDSPSGWRATFDWLTRKSNFYKVLELSYEGKDE